jgi:prepilin signal peptidase PulO-like enzyme (type II secretory pathway)
MLISSFVTTFLVPVGFALSMFKLLPLTLLGSIAGALFGYSFLYIINKIFKYMRNIDGIGEGDFDLLLLIGSFTGILGCWASITIGSILGSLYGLSLLLSQHNKNFTATMQHTKVPFGTFLALGALLFTFTQKYIFLYLTAN